MDDVEVVHGACLHGHAIQAVGALVRFVKECPPCAQKLTAEGFVVTTRPFLRAA